MKQSRQRQVTITEEKLIVNLADGHSIVVPIAWYPRLMYGSLQEAELAVARRRLCYIEWPDLDEHVGIEGLLAGRRSGESKKSLECWLATRMLGNANVDEQKVVV